MEEHKPKFLYLKGCIKMDEIINVNEEMYDVTEEVAESGSNKVEVLAVIGAVAIICGIAVGVTKLVKFIKHDKKVKESAARFDELVRLAEEDISEIDEEDEDEI